MGLVDAAFPPAVRKLGLGVRGVAFWVAVLLPMVYLPLLFVAPSTVADLWIFGALVALDAAALVVGHGYSEAGELSESSRADR
jgi:hypothetical protein